MRLNTRVVIFILATLVQPLAFSADKQGVEPALTREVKNLADWVIHAANHQHLPFIIIDKKAAAVFVFTPEGKLVGSSAGLLGITVGDDTAPGVGKKKLSEIRLHERTTPAGRFEADLGLDLNKTEILWIDYDSGVSMHVVVTGNAKERRLQRLLSDDTTQRRITYGCVNVSSQFYKSVIQPIFSQSSGIVYILPEIHSIQKVFGPEAARFSKN